MDPEEEPSTHSKLYYVVLFAIASSAIASIAYFVEYKYAMSVFTGTMEKIQKNSAETVAKINRDAAVARQAEADRQERERQAKLQAERDKLAAQQAAVDAVAAKEAAWLRFYRPSKKCESADARTKMDCVNEHVRAKREFEAKWATDSL